MASYATTPDPHRRGSRTIPAEHHAAVLERLRTKDPDTGKPYTSKAVATWLRETHNVHASSMAVLRLQAAVSEHGDRIIIAALREELRDAVAPVKARLLRATKKLDERLAEETNTQKVAAGVTAMTRALHELTQLGGVAAPISVDVTSGGRSIDELRAEFRQKLARLSQEPDADEEGPLAGEPGA